MQDLVGPLRLNVHNFPLLPRLIVLPLSAMAVPLCYKAMMDLEAVTAHSQELVLSVFESSPSYFLKVEGCLPTISTVEEALRAEPKEKCERYQKEFLLIREGGRAIGTAELHLHHPQPGIAYLGLLIIREDLFGKGKGRECYLILERYIKEKHSCQAVRLGVSNDNDCSGFWSKLGFSSNGRAYSYEGERKMNYVVEYEKSFV